MNIIIIIYRHGKVAVQKVKGAGVRREPVKEKTKAKTKKTKDRFRGARRTQIALLTLCSIPLRAQIMIENLPPENFNFFSEENPLSR